MRPLVSIALCSTLAGCAASPSIVEAPRKLNGDEQRRLAERVDALGDLVRLPLASEVATRFPKPATSATRDQRGRTVFGKLCIATERPTGRTLGGTFTVLGCEREATLVFGETGDRARTIVEIWVQDYEIASCENVVASPVFLSTTTCRLEPTGSPGGDDEVAADVARMLREVIATRSP